MRYILSILTMTVVFITLWVKPASAYLELDETAVQLGDCYANGSGGGKGGYIDIRTGVLVDTGPGYEPGSAKTPVDLTESRLLGEPGEHRKYYYRQVVGGPTLTIRGNVTIYCQFRFSAILVGDFTYGVPSVTIYAGHALEIDPSSPWSFPYGYDPPLGHQEAYPGFHALSFRHMTPQEGQESDGGRVTFHTTQHGNIDILFMYANGVAGGDIVLMANQGSISVIGEGPVTASGWGGGQGGTIALRAESISGHFYARDNDGEVNVAVDDDSRLETWADNVTQGSYISNPEAEPELVDKDNWTIIVYSAADDATHVEYYWQNLRIRMRRNSIEDDLERDLNSMENYSLSSKPVNLLVQMDRHPDNPLQYRLFPVSYDYDLPQECSWGQWHNSRRGWVAYDENIDAFSSVLVRSDPSADCEHNTGAPNVLSDYINWAMKMAPAEHTMLVISGHGGGWRGLAHDATSGSNRLTPYQLRSAIAGISGKIDILVLDVCLCSTIEILADLGPLYEEGKVTLVVASQSLGQSELFRHSWCGSLIGDPATDPRTLAENLVQSSAGPATPVKAAFDLAAYRPVQEAVKSFVDAARNPNLSWEDRAEISRACQFSGFAFGHHDLMHTMERMDDYLRDAGQDGYELAERAMNVKTQIQQMRIGFKSVLSADKVPNSGLSVYLPPGEADLSYYYAGAQSFCDATQWHAFLRECRSTWNRLCFEDDVSDDKDSAQFLDMEPSRQGAESQMQAAHSVPTPPGSTLVESRLGAPYDRDWFSFQADANQILSLDIVGLSGDLLSQGMVTLYNPIGAPITTVEADHDGGIAGTTVTLSSEGEYYLEVFPSIVWIPEQPPVGEGLYSLSLRLYDPDAYEPNLVADTSELDFGAVEGSETQVATITLTNTGGTSIEIAGIGLLEEFSPFFAPYSRIATPFTLGPGEPLEIDVGLQPYPAGVAEDTLVVVPADANYPVLEIPLRASTYDANNVFAIGGAVYADANDPAASGLEGVHIMLSGGLETYTAETSGSAGLWQIEDVPEGTYTLTPSRSGYAFEHVSGGIPDGQASIDVEVNEAHELANQDILFLAEPLPVQRHDWNGDGIVSIVGDVPPFVQCVYFGNCPQGIDPIAVGDCNSDGILSIVGDVPCFVDCVYFGNCPE